MSIALLQNAIAQHQQGQWQEAARLYQELLQQFPQHAQAMHYLGLLYAHQGLDAEACHWLQRSVTTDKNQAAVWVDLALLQYRSDQIEAALEACNQALDRDKSLVMAHFIRGNVLFAQQRWEEALLSYQETLRYQPDHADAWNNCGQICRLQEKWVEALNNFERAITCKTPSIEAWDNKGQVLNTLGRYAEAITHFDQAIVLQPGFADAFMHRAMSQYWLGNVDWALQDFGQALNLNPRHHQAWYNRGHVLETLGRWREAEADFNLALELQPDYAEAYLARANARLQQKQRELALADLEALLQRYPDHVDAWNKRGIVLHHLGRLDDALDSFDQAMAQHTHYAHACWNKALLLLLMGDYAAGWPLYEWRWQAQYAAYARHFAQPLWLGEEDLSGKVILIHAEQGFGDAIQFARYIPLVERLARQVVVELPESLMTLMASLSVRVIRVVRGEVLPEFDCHCPMLSLPLAFRTEVATIPASVPYLYADAERAVFWHQQLPEARGLKVGLVWRGQSAHANNIYRSMMLTELTSWFTLPVTFYVLQQELDEDERALLENYPSVQHDYPPRESFADTAALITGLDLVISVDTAVAHLAGALGKPAWVLLPYMPDYRWLLYRSDSPWYPTARLFRQSGYDDWCPVVAEVQRALQAAARGAEVSGAGIPVADQML